MRYKYLGFCIVLNFNFESCCTRFLLAFASIWGLGYGTGPYVPGEKGAPWTLEEALVVKAKLLSSMDFNGAGGNMWQVYKHVRGQHGFTGDDMPSESKVCSFF